MYKKEKTYNDAETLVDGIKVDVFTPKIFKKLTLPGKHLSIKQLGVPLMFCIITRGKSRIYYVMQDGKPAHTSYVIPKCGKFPFLNDNEYEIRPCVASPQFRGRGIYPQVLNYICMTAAENSVFFMIVDENNVSSIRGIEKLGFQRCGSVKVSKITKNYQLSEVLYFLMRRGLYERFSINNHALL